VEHCTRQVLGRSWGQTGWPSLLVMGWSRIRPDDRGGRPSLRLNKHRFVFARRAKPIDGHDSHFGWLGQSQSIGIGEPQPTARVRQMFPRFPRASRTPSHLEQNSSQSPTQRQAGSTTAVTLAPLGLKRRGASTSPSVPSGQLAGLLPCSQGVFNKRFGSTTGFSQPRISLSENTRNRARAEALARPLERVPDVRPIAQPKSLETIAGECGVTVAALEEHIQDELKSFCVETATSKFFYSKHWALFDTLYNLFLQSNDN
jgi:hypothetical protein